MPQNDLTSVSRAQTASPRPRKVPRVVVLGGGSVGLYAARRLRKKLGRREAAIVVVDPRPYMTYAPFLPEAAAGSIDGRDVVAPHRRALKGVDVLFIPVGGHVTVDAAGAAALVRQIQPRIAVPMHYGTDKVRYFEFDPVDPFLDEFDDVVELPDNRFQARRTELPEKTTIYVPAPPVD